MQAQSKGRAIVTDFAVGDGGFPGTPIHLINQGINKRVKFFHRCGRWLAIVDGVGLFPARRRSEVVKPLS